LRKVRDAPAASQAAAERRAPAGQNFQQRRFADSIRADQAGAQRAETKSE
jgi:hypothetical protein